MEPDPPEINSSINSAGLECKPTVLGAFVEWPDGFKYWRTMMQRWYGPDGKVQFLKAFLGPFTGESAQYRVNLEYGELTYQNNQVYLKDVLNNKLMMRVTLNDKQLPVASYFHNVRNADEQEKETDTCYYFYTNQRLDSMISIYYFHTRSTPNPTSPSWFIKYRFNYDSYGNLILIESGDRYGGSRIIFDYDYSKPIVDLLPYHLFNASNQILVYMDLLHIPIHHQLTQVISGSFTPGIPYPHETYPVFRWGYDNYVIDNGLVYSYTNDHLFPKKTYYTGWDCGSSAITSNAKILSVEEFQSRFPESKQKGKNLW